MSKGKGWNLTSLHSCESAAEWVRKNAGGLLVLVVRAEDCAFAVDGQISPADAVAMVECVLPGVQERLEAQRLEAKARAKRRPQRGLMERA